uniref:Uncharacterized protein n=1 Tax=viral metagenome TaxID=1070528 RepID=A0A6C0ISB6_9ZZZZ
MFVPFYYINNKWCFYEVTIGSVYYNLEWNTFSNGQSIPSMMAKLFDKSNNLLVLTMNKSNTDKNTYCYYNSVEQCYYDFEPDRNLIFELEDICFETDVYEEFEKGISDLYKHYECIEAPIEKME